jgi:hypothetical protein
MLRVLGAIPEGVDVTCVTRWLPQEIAAGVSDIDVWMDFRDHPRRRLLLRHDLHAKYYRVDDQCLVGSANLTGAAMGWSTTPNLELLVSIAIEDQGLPEFETRLMGGAIVVDDRVVEETLELVGALPDQVTVEVIEAAEDAAAEATVVDIRQWVPQLRQPEDLWTAYQGEAEDLSRVALEAAYSDLAVLKPADGLGEAVFNRAIGVALLRMPVINKIDDFVDVERRFGEVRELLSDLLQPDEPSSRVWQSVFRWLIYFLPDRYEYRRPHHSELIQRHPRISNWELLSSRRQPGD